MPQSACDSTPLSATSLFLGFRKIWTANPAASAPRYPFVSSRQFDMTAVVPPHVYTLVRIRGKPPFDLGSGASGVAGVGCHARNFLARATQHRELAVAPLP